MSIGTLVVAGMVGTATGNAPNTQRTIVTMHANYAELDSPPALVKTLGAEALQALNQKRAALVASTEATVLRFVPELSYGVPTRPTTSSR